MRFLPGNLRRAGPFSLQVRANVPFAIFQPLDIPVSLKSRISTLPACPLMPSYSSTNNATETGAELIILWSCCQNSALT